MALVENHLLKQVIWDYASKPFMKVTKNLNVTLVENHLLYVLPNLRGHIKTIHEGHKDYKCGSCGNHLLGLLLMGFISKHTKILNVNIVENHLLKLVIWEFKWKSFMKLKMISIVTLVENYFLIIITWKPFMNVKDFKCDSCEIPIIFSFSLPESTHQRSQRFLMWFMLNFLYSSWLQHSTLSLICIDDFLRSL